MQLYIIITLIVTPVAGAGPGRGSGPGPPPDQQPGRGQCWTHRRQCRSRPQCRQCRSRSGQRARLPGHQHALPQPPHHAPAARRQALRHAAAGVSSARDQQQRDQRDQRDQRHSCSCPRHGAAPAAANKWEYCVTLPSSCLCVVFFTH